MSTVGAKPEQAYWMDSRPAVADGVSTGLLDQPRRIARHFADRTVGFQNWFHGVKHDCSLLRVVPETQRPKVSNLTHS